MYGNRILRFFHPKLIAAVVSLFFLTGYTHDLVVDCSENHNRPTSEHGTTGSGGIDYCQCLCHNPGEEATNPLLVAEATLASVCFVSSADEFPPEVMPPGIDYPPQWA